MESFRYIMSVLVLGAGLMVAVPASAEDQLNGEILDLACFISHGAKGPSHERCAQTCAEHGMPLGLLAGDGKIYVLYPKHGEEAAFDTVKRLAGTRVKMSGLVQHNGGLLGFEVHATEPES